MMEERSIAFFDFDGTITTKDTLLEIIRYARGNGRFLMGFALLSPWILAMKLKLISNSSTKQKVLRFFFGNMPLDEFQQICSEFTLKKLPALIRPQALQQI